MRYAILTIITLICTTVSAQTVTITGRVVDEDHNAIELATVSCVEQGKVAMTNLKGEFSITLKSADSVVVKFSMVGYNSRKRVFRKPRGKINIEVSLPSMAALNEVVVTEKRRQTGGMEQLNVKDMKQTPSATGNAVEDMIQQQAGVANHNELSSQYNVRGGSFNENSVYINNVEIYRPMLVNSGQQEGLSIINADMVESLSFSTGGFDARYGDKMSSALDIQYKRPTKNEAHLQASLLGANIYGAITSKKFTMSHGLRYKTNRNLLGTLDTKGEYKPTFLDYQTYITYKPNERWMIDVIGDMNENHYNFIPTTRETAFGTMENVKSFRVYFDGNEKDVFRTMFGTLGIEHRFAENTKMKLLFSAFHSKEKETYDIQGQYWLDDTQTSENLGVGTYLEHARNYLTSNMQSIKILTNHKWGHHQSEAGVTFKWEKIKEVSREYEMRDSSGYNIPHSANRLDLIYSLISRNLLSSRRIEGYIQDTYRWASKEDRTTHYTLNYGVRLSHWSYSKEMIVSPRISLAIIPAACQDMTLRFATGLYYQTPFYKELRDTVTYNGRTVVELNNKVKSQQSLQFIVAMDYRFKINERPFKFSAEGYYKNLHNLIPYNVQNLKITYDASEQCNGYAMGLDMKLYGEFVPGTDSWFTLSVMKTQQKTINGVKAPLPTDQRWGANLHFTDYFPGTTRWKMTLKLAFADGLPFGAPHKGLASLPFRAPAYRRADIGMSYLAFDNDGKKKNIPIKKVWIGMDCLNLFGINNVSSYYWVTDVTNQQYAVPNYLTGRQINAHISVYL